MQETFADRETDYIRANLLLHPLREGNRNSGAFTLGCKAAKAGCDLEAIYANLAKEICGDDFAEEELKRTLSSAYQKVASDKGRGVGHSSGKPETVNPSNRHYICRENEKSREDDYLAGEELRRNTPQFSEEVYENIPTMLSECLEEDMLPHRREVRLLASLSRIITQLRDNGDLGGIIFDTEAETLTATSIAACCSRPSTSHRPPS